MRLTHWVWVLLVGLVGCDNDTRYPGSEWTPGEYVPASGFAARCARPRSGIDPYTGRGYRDLPGSSVLENQWLRAWTHESYLWFDEVPDLDPASLDTPAYFQRMKTPALSGSGRARDRFHFSYPTDVWQALLRDNQVVGYGLTYRQTGNTGARRLQVALVDSGAPEDVRAAGVMRGTEIVSVDGVDVASASADAEINRINAGLVPSEPGERHRFVLRNPGEAGTVSVTLTARAVVTDPVPLHRVLDTASGRVAYVLFNDHLAEAEDDLVEAFSDFVNAGVSELVLDMRYNSGGSLDIASMVASMIAGAQGRGAVFERLVTNSRLGNRHPYTGALLRPVMFRESAPGYRVAPGTPLPMLSLPRVFVISGADTCSASESVINGLQGVGIEVILIGEPTCGKPFGFYPTDNCGTTYFSVQVRGENAVGFGAFEDGFAPAGTAGGVSVQGCSVGDDLARAIGDPLEAPLAAALAWRSGQGCPAGAKARTRRELPVFRLRSSLRTLAVMP